MYTVQNLDYDIADIANLDHLRLAKYFVTPRQWADFVSGEGRLPLIEIAAWGRWRGGPSKLQAGECCWPAALAQHCCWGGTGHQAAPWQLHAVSAASAPGRMDNKGVQTALAAPAARFHFLHIVTLHN